MAVRFLFASSALDQLLNALRKHRSVRVLASRYGRAYWKLPKLFRKHICYEQEMRRLPEASIALFDDGEKISAIECSSSVRALTLGHRLTAQCFTAMPACIAQFGEAWLVGEYATVVTRSGRMLMSSFHDEPLFLGLEPRPELERFLRGRQWASGGKPQVQPAVVPMVSRLQKNYYHWLVEWCGRLQQIEWYEQQTGIKPSLLIPREAPAFLRETLSLLGYGADRWIEWDAHGEPALYRNVIVPSFRGDPVSPSLCSLIWLRNRLLAAAGVCDQSPERLIYLSRGYGGWRSILNEREVRDTLGGEGFTTVEPGAMSVVEQIRLFAQAKLVVGLHGAGLTNILFAKNAVLLELLGSYSSGLYYGIATRTGSNYMGHSCVSAGDDVVVEIPKLVGAVRSALAVT